VGGFRPLHVGEDVDLVDRLLSAGTPLAGDTDNAVLTSDRRDFRAAGGFGDYVRSLAEDSRSSVSYTDTGIIDSRGRVSTRGDGAIHWFSRVRRVAALWADPGEAEGVSGRIAKDPKGILGAFVADVGYSNCCERQHFSLRSVDVVDVDVEVKLLRALRVGESWRLMLCEALECQSDASLRSAIGRLRRARTPS
jgi:hypothetical protein